MRQVALIAVWIVALLHLYFMVLEMFLWTKPAGLKAFGQTPEQAASSKVLAANQGLYNGLLALGLIWGAVANEFHIMLFFLGWVIVAGIFGAVTASRKILYVQALPGLIALVLLHLP